MGLLGDDEGRDRFARVDGWAVVGRGLLGFQKVDVFVCQGDGFEVGCDADASAAGGAEIGV